MIEIIVVHLVITLLVMWVVMSIGKMLLTYSTEYQPITSLFDAENSTGFNAVYRILSVPVLIMVASIAMYSLRLDEYVTDIWYIAIYYFVAQAVLIISLGRWTLVNKSKFFLFHILSIMLTYYLYTVAISKGLSYLLPDESNLRTEIWLVIAAFIYGLFKNIPENNHTFENRKTRYIKSKARRLSSKYRFILDKYDATMSNILVATMVYENFNRPYTVRLIEKITPSKTRHIMQVHEAKSDEESIAMTASEMKEVYDEFKKTKYEDEWDERSGFEEIFSVHNPDDDSYGYRVHEIYEIINS